MTRDYVGNFFDRVWFVFVTLTFLSGCLPNVMAQDQGAAPQTPLASALQAELTASDGTANDNFGNAVAVSGNTALAGANRQPSQANRGGAYVFVRTGATTWVQQQKLLATDVANGDTFGAAVAIDGDTAVVSSPLHRVNSIAGVGAVYVFVRNGSTWTQLQELTPSDGALNNQFGSSVAISGRTIAVGSWMATVGANSRQGAVYIFTFQAGKWNQTQKLTASTGAANDQLGASVAMTTDFDPIFQLSGRIVAGALQNNFGATGNGAAWVFIWNGTMWVEEQKLTAGDGASLDAFGNAVSISSGGDTIAVGAYHDDDGAVADRGAVYVFVQNGTWTQQQKLQGSLGINNGFGNEFGTAVAVDGNTIFAGAPSVNFVAGGGRGGVYEFDRSGAVWTEAARIGSPTNVISNFGCALSMSGANFLVGASTDTVGTTLGEGSAYIFSNGSQFQLSSHGYFVNEGAGNLAVKIEHTGDLSVSNSVTAAVPAFSIGLPCSDTTNNKGQAFYDCDYSWADSTFTFAPGDLEKSLSVSIIDDAFVEGDENFAITLEVSTGGFSPPLVSRADILIVDNDGPGEANPILTSAFFVREHYLDFLSREPDASGQAFWNDQMANCGAADLTVCHVNVSAAFFVSIEFQQTGYLVYRGYGAAFGTTRIGGTVPLTLAEFLPDLSRLGNGVVVGANGWEAQLEANKVAYFNDFVTRAAFTTAYPSTMTNAAFVDALNANAGGALATAERNQLVADLTSGAKTRAQALRAVAENAAFSTAQFNRAFVLSQYFGYLGRNPNDKPDTNFDGYNFWLNKLNSFNGNYINAEMVKAFITSDEYRLRFGQ
jgi:hypothetical protein